MADDCKDCKRRAAKDERDKLKRAKAEKTLRARIERDARRDAEEFEEQSRLREKLGVFSDDLRELELEGFTRAERSAFRTAGRALEFCIPRTRAELIAQILAVHVFEADPIRERESLPVDDEA